MVRLRLAGLASLCMAVSPQISHTYANFIARDSSEPNPSVSSGTCYYSPGNEADSDYIPCGNTAFGVFSCCASGSICMDHNACYLKPNTYVAGCTDPTYSDPSCPGKGPYADQQWSGMSYCNGTSDQWTLCNDAPSGSDTPIPWPGCYCPLDETLRLVAFAAPGNIASQISLPSSSGGTMSFYDGYSPSTVPTSTTVPTSATRSSSSNAPASTNSEVFSSPTASGSPTVATSSPSISQPTQHKSSLSSGAKIGIGVGAGLGVSAALAVIAAMALYIHRLRKRKSEHEDNPDRPHSKLPAVEKDHSVGSAWPTPGLSENTSELAGNDSRDLSSIISPESTQRTWSRPMSTEMEGSIPNHPSMASLRSQELGTDSPVYRAYRAVKEVPVGVHRAPGSSNISQASYRPGRQIGDGVYEMPAQLPGSTFLDR